MFPSDEAVISLIPESPLSNDAISGPIAGEPIWLKVKPALKRMPDVSWLSSRTAIRAPITE